MNKRELLGDCVIVFAGALLLLLGVIDQLKAPQGYYGAEPNPYILWFEIVMSIGIIILGVDRAIKDKGCELREAIGNIVMILCGVTLTGMFVTIAIKGQFFMAPIETWFIVMRCVIAVVLIILGIERYNDDLPKKA